MEDDEGIIKSSDTERENRTPVVLEHGWVTEPTIR